MYRMPFILFATFVIAEYRTGGRGKVLLFPTAGQSVYQAVQQRTFGQDDGEAVHVRLREPPYHLRQPVHAQLDLVRQSRPYRSGNYWHYQ